MKFNGKILVIGYGSVSRCALPLVFKHIQVDPRNVTVMDFADLGAAANTVAEFGARFVREKITRDGMGRQLAKYVGRGDLIIDLAWNIGCDDILQWCHDHDVLYVNTSVEMWDPYEGAATKPPTERTLYVRHIAMRRMVAKWKKKPGPTAVVDHGANPGLVSHFTKEALEDIADRWLDDNKRKSARREQIAGALAAKAYNKLAQALGVKVIHISERDTQISNLPKRVDEFVNTWSIEGFFEEGTAPAEIGWGTHERNLPPKAHWHRSGPGNQICLANFGVRTWVRSWVPDCEIVGMVIRHGEAFSISEHLTVTQDGAPVYRPTVHYAYCPCDAAIVSLHELHMRNFQLQPALRIMNDEITDGEDRLGCLLMGHDYKSWWIGSLLDIHESRRLVPHQNATTLQVACSVVAAAQWMIANPRRGVCLPDHLPHEFILKHAKPYLGPFVSKAVDWTPLDNWDRYGQAFTEYGNRRPTDEDVWQFNTFLVRLG
ncbi:MAG: saccharopine dehydrogenase C-terminal domain-containing protein [Phycisphaerae bacterium]